MTDTAAAPPDATASPATPEARAHRRHAIRLQDVTGFARLWEVTKRAAIGVYTDGFIHAGNLAYLSLMTLFPFVIVAAATLSLVGQSAETQRAVGSFLHVLPPDVADILRKPIADVLLARTGSLLWLGALVGLWTVSGFVDTIRDIFRKAYGTPGSAVFWKSRLRTSGAIVASVIIALISFVIQGVLLAAQQFIYKLLPFAEHVAGLIGLSRAIPGVVMFGALYVLFYTVTPAKYRYSKCRKWPGALFTTVWWLLLTALLPKVLALLGGYSLTYGGLAGVVVMLLFFWLIGLGIVFGAHLNAALAEPPEAGVKAAATQSEQEARATT